MLFNPIFLHCHLSILICVRAILVQVVQSESSQLEISFIEKSWTSCGASIPNLNYYHGQLLGAVSDLAPSSLYVTYYVLVHRVQIMLVKLLLLMVLDKDCNINIFKPSFSSLFLCFAGFHCLFYALGEKKPKKTVHHICKSETASHYK